MKEFPFWIRNTEDVPPPPPGPQPPIKVRFLSDMIVYTIHAGPYTVYGLSRMKKEECLAHHIWLVII